MAIWCHHFKHYKEKLRQQGTLMRCHFYSHISNSGKILKLLCRVVHSANVELHNGISQYSDLVVNVF